MESCPLNLVNNITSCFCIQTSCCFLICASIISLKLSKSFSLCLLFLSPPYLIQDLRLFCICNLLTNAQNTINFASDFSWNLWCSCSTSSGSIRYEEHCQKIVLTEYCQWWQLGVDFCHTLRELFWNKIMLHT